MAIFIANPKGAVHSIPDDWAIPQGCREATPEEIRQWLLNQGIRTEVADDGTSNDERFDQLGKRPHRRSRRD